MLAFINPHMELDASANINWRLRGPQEPAYSKTIRPTNRLTLSRGRTAGIALCSDSTSSAKRIMTSSLVSCLITAPDQCSQVAKQSCFRQIISSTWHTSNRMAKTVKLYKRNGMMLWKGYDFIASPDGKSVIVDAENMRNIRWDSQNRPQATLYT